MLELPHVLVGAAIGAKLQNPVLAIPLAFASHFVLDILPHWNPHINQEIKKFGKPTKFSTRLITVDSTLALLIGSSIALNYYPDMAKIMLILLCCFAAVLPDVVEAPYYFLGKKSQLVENWIKWQKSIQNDVPAFWGLLVQGAIIIGSLLWIFT